MTRFSLILILAALAAVSCGRQQDRTQINNDAMAFRTIQDIPLDVQCANKQNCSPSVGMIASVMNTKKGIAVGSCTGFLVTDDIFLTNDHCLDSSLQAHTSCQNFISVEFPDTGAFPAERKECGTVLWRTNDSSEDDSGETDEKKDANIYTFDAAYIKLSGSSSRPPLRVNHSGVSPNEIVKIFKINPTNEKDMTDKVMRGRLETQECRVVQNTVFDPAFDNPHSLGFALTSTPKDSCEILTGNSGSPIVRNNEAIGIAHIGLLYISKQPAGAKVPSAAVSVRIEGADGIKRSVSWSTNLSCIPDPTHRNYVLPKECFTSFDPKYVQSKDAELNEKMVESFLSESMPPATEWGQTILPMFHWDLIPVGKGHLLPLPFCSLAGGLKSPGFRSLGFLDWNHTVQDLRVPYFKVQNVVSDENFMPHFKFEKVSEMTTYDMTFNPLAIRFGESSKITIKIPGKSKDLTYRIEKCKTVE